MLIAIDRKARELVRMAKDLKRRTDMARTEAVWLLRMAQRLLDEGAVGNKPPVNSHAGGTGLRPAR